MICLNCKKQIPDNATSCPSCGKAVDHQEQLPKEISFRRYQRWAFYALIAVIFIGMIGVIVKIMNTNSELIANISTANKNLNETKAALDLTTEDLAKVASNLKDTREEVLAKEALLSQIETDLSEKNKELEEKTVEFKKVLDEITEVNANKENCELDLSKADSNIYSLIIKLGQGVSDDNLNKIPLADSNFDGEDTDGDGLSDVIERALGTSIDNADTDGDGYDDKSEVMAGFNPNGAGSLNIDNNYAKQQIGKILLQVDQAGEAWYVAGDGKRYFLGNPADAFRVMRDLDYWTGAYSTATST